MKENLAVLRHENSTLMMEMIEMKNDISLRDEQVRLLALPSRLCTKFNIALCKVNALKVTVRELEASLMREKEFNAANRRINADYLVNVLRNFLMSGNPSER